MIHNLIDHNELSIISKLKEVYLQSFHAYTTHYTNGPQVYKWIKWSEVKCQRLTNICIHTKLVFDRERRFICYNGEVEMVYLIFGFKSVCIRPLIGTDLKLQYFREFVWKTPKKKYQIMWVVVKCVIFSNLALLLNHNRKILLSEIELKIPKKSKKFQIQVHPMTWSCSGSS